MKKIFIAFLVTALGIILFINFNAVFSGEYIIEADHQISRHYIEQGVKETGAINLVTSILFDYRAFDTMGEATVIFVAVSTVTMLVNKRRLFIAHTNFSPIVHQTISFILPFLYVLGIYLTIYGHLSPGGGFAGGVVLATIFILMTVTFGIRHIREEKALKTRSLIEDIGALGFIFIGILGIAAGYNFLANSQAGIYLGTPGKLISAGTIPYLNLAVAAKVATGLGIIFYCLVKEE